MSNLGQLNLNDDWIIATIFSFYMGLYHIPSIKIKDREVFFPNGRSVFLTEKSECEIESVIKATKIYFSDKKYSDIYKLNILGTPNVISKLFFGMNFKIYSTSLLNFYYKITIKNIENILRNRNSKEVFMFIFKNLSSHLYVYHDISDDNMLSVFDISNFEIKETNISTSDIYILFRLDLSSIKDV